MEILCQDFDRFFSEGQEDAYALAFLLTRSKKAADAAFLHALLTLAEKNPSSDDQAREILTGAVLDECEDYYLRKLRRAPGREILAEKAPFKITDALWALLKEPYALKAAAFLTGRMGYDVKKAAALLHMSAARVNKLAGMKLNLAPLSAVRMPDAEAQGALDAVYMRFSERNVPLENRLRKFRRAVDNLVPWLALLVIALFAAAALYTANLPVPPIE